MDVFHGDVQQVIGYADIVDGDDIGVVERSKDPAFGNEPLGQVFGLVSLQLVQNLQHHGPLQGFLDGEIHRRHAPLADFSLDDIAGYFHAVDYKYFLAVVVFCGGSSYKPPGTG